MIQVFMLSATTAALHIGSIDHMQDIYKENMLSNLRRQFPS